MLVEAPGVDGGSTGSDGGGGSSATSSSTANSNSASSHLSSSTTKSGSSTDGKTAMNGRAPMDVEARLAYTPPHVLIRSISSLSQHSIRPRTPEPQEDGAIPTLRKGVLFQARDRLFSRWKERYFVLTRDYLACFRRCTTKYSEMGSFIFKVNLASVEAVDWQERRGGPVLAIALPREGRVLLRAKSGLEQWYRLLMEATMASRQRRNALKRGTSTTHLNHLSSHYDPILPSPFGALQYSLSDSTPEIAQLCESSVSSDTSPRVTTLADRSHRFSLMSEVDVGSCGTDVATPPSSVTSSHKFSSSTSNTSGSGGSSSLASSPSLRGPWPRPSSPLRPLLGDVAPRSRFSLYEGPREAIHVNAKTRYSVCVEPRELNSDLTPSRKRFPGLGQARHSICAEPRELHSSRISLSMEPRNPLLDLLESVENAQLQAKQKKTSLVISGKVCSPAKSVSSQPSSSPQQLPPPTRDAVETSPSPPSTRLRPRAQSTSVTTDHSALTPRSRTNLALFRHSALFN